MSISDIENTALRRSAVAAYYIPAMVIIAVCAALEGILEECGRMHRLARRSWQKR